MVVGNSQKFASRSRRPGALHAVELMLLLPIVLAIVLGMIEYSLMLSADQQLAVASRQGARVAAQGGRADEVEASARLALGTGRLAKRAVVKSLLSDVSGTPVTVAVSVPDAATVIPNMLRFVGFSIKNRPLAGSTVMMRE
jgi:Flp pilus assembly protein TadG